MFCWNADMIRFLCDAAEQVGFYDTLARLALERMPGAKNVVDAGCGLGYLSLALAKRVSSVTAADMSAPALVVLRQNIDKCGAGNIRVLEGDIFAHEERPPFDGAVFCFFGGTEETLRFIRRNCTGKAVLFKKYWDTHRFSLQDEPLGKYSCKNACAELDGLNVPYRLESVPVEMGQPFRSAEDAVTFFRLHRRGEQADVSEAAVLQRLAKTDSAEFPYYMPAKRPVGVITLDAGEIPDSI